MPTFVLTDPSGAKFKVTAPDEQSAVAAFKKMQSGPETGLVEDVAKSAGSGLVQGVTGLLGLPGDIQQFAGWGAGKVAKVLGGDEEKVKNAVRTGIPVIGGIWDSQDTADALKKVTGFEPYEPKTTAGKFTRTVAEFVPGAVATGPGAVASVLRGGAAAAARTGARNAATFGALPGVASEAAGQATKGTGYEPYARAAGAIAGAGPGMLLRPGYAERRIAGDVAGVTDAQFDAATELARRANAAGMPITADEAIQAATGGASRIGETRRIVESTERGGQVLNPPMANRAPQADTIMRGQGGVLDNIAPASREPAMDASRVRDAAERVINDARQANNRVAQPYYDNLRGQFMPQADYARIAANESYAAALRDLRANPELAFRYANLPDNDLSVVNAVVKRLDQGIENATPTPLQRGDHEIAAARTAARADANQAAGAASTDYTTARDLVRQGNEAIVDPLRAGPVGAITKTTDAKAQADALFTPAAEVEARRAVVDLTGVAPDPTRSVVRQGVEDKYNRSLRGDPTQPFQTGPDSSFNAARFAKSVRDNPSVARNIVAAIEEAAGPAAAQAFTDMVDVFGATGWRMRPGSKTAFNAEAVDEIKRGGLFGVASAAAKPFSAASDAFAKLRLDSATDRLARILASGPEGVERIRWLAANVSDRPTRDALVRVLAQPTTDDAVAGEVRKFPPLRGTVARDRRTGEPIYSK